MKHRTSRRGFLKTTAAAGVGFWAAGGVSPRPSRSANEEISFASIGVQGKGKSDSRDAGDNGNVVAICDIDDRNLDKGADEFPQAKKYNDWRKMFDEMGKSIDAVTVSTPDHSHAPATAAAMRLGIHCYTQKPLTHSLFEARRLGEIAKETGVATQMGNQGTANRALRKAAAMIQGGLLGTVQEVHVWTNRPIWPQGEGRPEAEPVPAHVKWDLFIGPAEWREYSQLYHPFKWRGWWVFGTGALGDMACHTLNMPFMALDLKDPTSIVARTSGHNGESYPKWSVIDYDYPATEKRAGVKFTWYDGGQKPDMEKFQGHKQAAEISRSGALIIGDKGRIYSGDDYCGNYELLGDLEEIDAEYEASPGHFTEWVQAIKGGKPARSNFADYGAPLTETVLLGNLAVWAAAEGEGKKIEWDAKNLAAKNAPEVAHIIKQEYREGYTL